MSSSSQFLTLNFEAQKWVFLQSTLSVGKFEIWLLSVPKVLAQHSVLIRLGLRAMIRIFDLAKPAEWFVG